MQNIYCLEDPLWVYHQKGALKDKEGGSPRAQILTILHFYQSHRKIMAQTFQYAIFLADP